MRVNKKVTKPALEERVVEEYDHTKCDRYGKDVNWQKEGDSWFDQDTKIQSFSGDVFPECDSREGWSIDCCPKCFEDAVLPALKKAGFKIPEKRDIWDDEPEELIDETKEKK